MSESETMRIAFMDYAKELSLIKEKIKEKGTAQISSKR